MMRFVETKSASGMNLGSAIMRAPVNCRRDLGDGQIVSRQARAVSLLPGFGLSGPSVAGWAGIGGPDKPNHGEMWGLTAYSLIAGRRLMMNWRRHPGQILDL